MYILFFLLWIIFNANFTLEICIFGLIIAAVLFLFICSFMDYSIKKELSLYKKLGTFFKFVVLLVLDIVKANLATVRLILSQKEEIEPALVTFDTTLETPVGKTLLADAITLTPGTITVSLDGSTFRVHCLDKELADGLTDSRFEKLAHKLEETEELRNA